MFMPEYVLVGSDERSAARKSLAVSIDGGYTSKMGV